MSLGDIFSLGDAFFWAAPRFLATPFVLARPIAASNGEKIKIENQGKVFPKFVFLLFG